MSELIRIKLREHISILSGFPFASESFSDREGVPLIRIRDLLSEGMETFYTGPYPDDFLVEDGDVLVGMDGDFNIVRWSKGRALLNQRVCRVFSTSKMLDQGFLFWVLGPELLKIHRRTPQTTVRHLSTKDIYEIQLEVPPEQEQAKVAQILDTLDTQIRQTEVLISKLGCIKQGLLTDLLTRGIDQNGRLRPSPDQAPHLYKDSALGRIPKEWNLSPLVSFASTCRGSFVNGPFGSDLLTSELHAEGVPVVYVKDIAPGRYKKISSSYVTEAKADQLAVCNVEPGDVLIAKVGDPPGTAARYDRTQRAIVTQDVIRIRPAPDVSANFLVSLLNSKVCHQAIRRIVIEGTRARVALTQYKALELPKPNLEEQKAIGNYLSAMQGKIHREIAGVDKLRVKKFGLMDDLLAGHVRVTPFLEAKEPSTT